ncbi:MAG: RRXRR domain-containing protein [Desulfovibrio sp.]|nr:RRXRR domain-containing protein [Desulfovibrio sp.]
MAVFVLDRHKKSLTPCSEKRARQLLERRRARVHRMHPFTIRLVDRLLRDSVVSEVVMKIDPSCRKGGISSPDRPATTYMSCGSSNRSSLKKRFLRKGSGVKRMPDGDSRRICCAEPCTLRGCVRKTDFCQASAARLNSAFLRRETRGLSIAQRHHGLLESL